MVSIGLAVIGGVAAGVYAYGATALGWAAAKGEILAGAGTFTQGPTAFGVQANDSVAQAYFETQGFFPGAEAVTAAGRASAFFLWVVPLLLIGGDLGLSRSKAG